MRTLRGPQSLRCAFAATVLALAVAPAGWSQHQHGHDHEASQAAVTQMRLDGGKKWATDASLRADMAAIHAAFEADHPAIHAGTETDAQYEALAGTVSASEPHVRQEEGA